MTSPAPAPPPDEAWIAAQLANAPAALTEAQARVVSRALTPPANAQPA